MSQGVNEIMAIHSTPNAFTLAECERIIDAIATVDAKDARLVGQNKDPDIRTASLVWVDDVDGLGWVMDRLIELVRKSNTNQFDFDLQEFAESPQVASYKASDSGHFAWHSDIGDGPLAKKRKLTLVLQLSNASSYEGGDLEVMPGAHVLSANRAQGCASIFPSYALHQVTPVVKGIRHSITVWAHGPAFR